jgi:hypothetical protein
MTLYVCANAYSGLRYPGWLRVGNVAMGDVDVHVGSVAISFMEKIGTGAVQNTIISFTGDSVHSRHTLLAGQTVPSQYYGECAKQ